MNAPDEDELLHSQDEICELICLLFDMSYHGVSPRTGGWQTTYKKFKGGKVSNYAQCDMTDL